MDKRLLDEYASEKQLKENEYNNYINNNSSISANDYNTNLNNNINSNPSHNNFPFSYNNNKINDLNNNNNNDNVNKDYLLIQDSNNKDSLINKNPKIFKDLNMIKIQDNNDTLNNNSTISNNNQINNSQQNPQENNYINNHNHNNNNNNLLRGYQSQRNLNNSKNSSFPEDSNPFGRKKSRKQPKIPSKSNNTLSGLKFPALQKQKLKSSLSIKTNLQNKSNYLTTYEKTHNLNHNQIPFYDCYEKKSKTKLFILDNIIENLSFSKNHLALILICVCNMMLDGYLTFIISKISILSFKFYQWNKKENLNFLLAQQFFLALGALISTNTRSIHWDVRSNTLVSFIGAMALFLLHFYTDVVSFCALISIFSVCHGFISNICTNFLLELMNLKYRSLFYCFAYSFKIFGMFTGVWFIHAFSDNNRVDNPIVYTIGLPVGEIILSFLLFFNIDSLRVLFYSDEIGILFDLLQEMDFIDEFTGVKYFDVDLHKKNFVVKLDDSLFDVNLDLLEKGADFDDFKGKLNDKFKDERDNEYNTVDSENVCDFGQMPYRWSYNGRDSEQESDEDDYRSNYKYVHVPGRKTTKLNIDPNELRKKILEAKSSSNNLLSPEKIQEKKFNIPIFEDDQAHLYFNPIFTDDFIFKKAILKRFENIKKNIERIYGVQENHGVFNSFYILLTKKYYVNTLTSIFFVMFSTLIFINVHFIYPELDFYKLKHKVDININDPNYIELNINNLTNKQLVFYFLALFICFNFLSIIQHIVLSWVMNYNSFFAYDSVKNLEKHLDESDKKFLASEDSENENAENSDDPNLRLNNQNHQVADEKEFFIMEDFIKKIQTTIKEKLKNDILFAARIKGMMHTFCLITVLICIGCFVFLKHQNIYVLFVFDLFMLYYCCLIYYYFSEKSTTLLRNCTTSIMYVSICFITIAQNLANFNISYVNLLIMCFALGVVLAVLDWILIDHTVSFKGLQKVEFSIMKKHKK